jgi:hypothetical protein
MGVVETFYEAVGHMIAAQNDLLTKQGLIMSLMELPNQLWSGGRSCPIIFHLVSLITSLYKDTLHQKSRCGPERTSQRGSPQILIECSSFKHSVLICKKTRMHFLLFSYRACQAIGHEFVVQIDKVFSQMLTLYNVLSNMIAEAAVAYGSLFFLQIFFVCS